MARSFDETIGAWIEDENSEDEAPAQCGQMNEDAGMANRNGELDEEDNTDDKKAADVAPENKKINKRLILYIIAGAVLFLVVMRLAIPAKTKRKAKNEMQKAGEVEMPDFGDYRNRQTVEDRNPEAKEVAFDGDKGLKQPPAYMQRPEQHRESYSGAEQQSDDYKEAAKAGFGGKTEDLTGGRSSPQRLVQQTPSASAVAPGMSSPADYLAQGGLVGGMKDEYASQNRQDDKMKFAEKNKGDGGDGYYLGEDTVWPGTIITGVLLQGINSDIPGQIKAMVTENVYDSLNGRDLLIPQGSTLIAEYNSNLSYNQSRLQVAWSTLIRPDGYMKDLGNMNGVDPQGRSGISGFVDEHLFEYFKAMGLITFFTYINGEFTHSLGNTDNQYAQNIITANQSAVQQLGDNMIGRALNIQPSIHIGHGAEIKIFINQAMYFPPLKDNTVTSRYIKE